MSVHLLSFDTLVHDQAGAVWYGQTLLAYRWYPDLMQSRELIVINDDLNLGFMRAVRIRS